MSSRGYFVGAVIDDLDAIASQVRQRCKLGQNDLNRVLEDFFKELLNLVRGSNLRNLNNDRSNAPGLDLGDKTSARKVAFQVTSQADAAKINKTLSKLTPQQLSDYDEINVLIIGQRQSNYVLDEKLTKKTGFKQANIIGITELCREIMDLDLSTLQAVQRKLADEQQRIRIELEPMINGKFQTSVLDSIEPAPSVSRSDATLLVAHPAVQGLYTSASEAADDLNAFIDNLQRLPRLTREFFGWLFDECDARNDANSHDVHVNADYVAAKCTRLTSLRADLRLLQSRGFVSVDQDESWKSAVYHLTFPGGGGSDLRDALLYFMRAEELSASDLFSTMNFSVFGPAPSLAAPAVPPPATKSKKTVLKRRPAAGAKAGKLIRRAKR